MLQTNQLQYKYQQDKEDIALFRRDGLTWPYLLPLAVLQTLFPSILHELENK